MVVTSAERARDLPNPPARIAGVVDSHLRDGHVMFNYFLEDLTEFTECVTAAERLWKSTGLRPQDMDAAMIYENFSPVVFLQLEGFGFCGRGEAKDFIADGNIALGGSLPVNTHGGLLGEAYIHGVNNILEGVRQIRGTAVNQVPNAEHVLIAGGRGGLVLGRG
jgi:acetyl-CoA acetyltransferase